MSLLTVLLALALPALAAVRTRPAAPRPWPYPAQPGRLPPPGPILPIIDPPFPSTPPIRLPGPALPPLVLGGDAARTLRPPEPQADAGKALDAFRSLFDAGRGTPAASPP
ncbi:MAG: hypothetical protein HY554_02335 [Elusimicrobia bacterium]|nr:hypothetical protein [Elusimicrobiota bacterium]